jgi:NTP pyrophosphatase (non-canonical NTP hydrolase)
MKPLYQQQWRVGRWVHRCFGPDVLYNPKERAMRLLEESLELAQAVGVGSERAAGLVTYVYGRPVGEAKQELGGCAVTLLAAAESLGLSLEITLEEELTRIEDKDPEHFRERHNRKIEAGVSGNADSRISVQ